MMARVSREVGSSVRRDFGGEGHSEPPV
jgi:hypothetical protein